MLNRISAVVFFFVLVVATLAGCSSANKAVEEGGAAGMDLSQQLMGSFGDVGKILGSITDTATAESAVPQLEGVGGDLDKLAAEAAKASPDVQSSLSDMATAQIPGLKEITDTVYAIPGVEPIVKPQLDSVLAKFAGF